MLSFKYSQGYILCFICMIVAVPIYILYEPVIEHAMFYSEWSYVIFMVRIQYLDRMAYLLEVPAKGLCTLKSLFIINGLVYIAIYLSYETLY